MMGKTRLPFEPPVRVVARLSYSLYLVHYPLVPFAMVIAQSGEYPSLRSGPPILVFPLLAPACCISASKNRS